MPIGGKKVFQFLPDAINARYLTLADITAVDDLGKVKLYKGALNRLSVAELLHSDSLTKQYLKVAHEVLQQEQALSDVRTGEPLFKNNADKQAFMQKVSRCFTAQAYSLGETVEWPKQSTELRGIVNQDDAEELLSILDSKKTAPKRRPSEVVRERGQAVEYFKKRLINTLLQQMGHMDDPRRAQYLFGLITELKKDHNTHIHMANLEANLRTLGLELGEKQLYAFRGANRDLVHWFRRHVAPPNYLQSLLQRFKDLLGLSKPVVDESEPVIAESLVQETVTPEAKLLLAEILGEMLNDNPNIIKEKPPVITKPIETVRLGLANCGNTCYANSALKFLMVSHGSYLLTYLDVLESDSVFCEDKASLKSLKILKSILQRMHNAEVVSESEMRRLWQSLCETDALKNFHFNQQQDASEFYLALNAVFKLDGLMQFSHGTTLATRTCLLQEDKVRWTEEKLVPSTPMTVQLGNLKAHGERLSLQSYFDNGILDTGEKRYLDPVKNTRRFEHADTQATIQVDMKTCQHMDVLVTPYTIDFVQKQLRIEKIAQTGVNLDELVRLNVRDSNTQQMHRVTLRLDSFISHMGRQANSGHYMMYERHPKHGWICHNDSQVYLVDDIHSENCQPTLCHFSIIHAEPVPTAT